LENKSENIEESGDEVTTQITRKEITKEEVVTSVNENDKEETNIIAPSPEYIGKTKSVQSTNLLKEGELIEKKNYENGARYRYCFDGFDKCDETFALQRCYEIRDGNGCSNKKKVCKFRIRKGRCCLMYMCEFKSNIDGNEPSVENLDGVTEISGTPSKDKETHSSKETENSVEDDNAPINDKETEITTENKNSVEDDNSPINDDISPKGEPEGEQEESNDRIEQLEMVDDETKRSTEEQEIDKDIQAKEAKYDETNQMNNQDSAMDENLKNMETRDNNHAQIEEKYILGIEGKDKNDKKENNESIMKNEKNNLKTPCIKGQFNDLQCKKEAHSWCKLQSCAQGSVSRCQFKNKKGKCCRRHRCKVDTTSSKQQEENVKAGETIVKDIPLMYTDKLTLYIGRDTTKKYNDNAWHKEAREKCAAQTKMFDMGCSVTRNSSSDVFCMENYCVCYVKYDKCSVVAGKDVGLVDTTNTDVKDDITKHDQKESELGTEYTTSVEDEEEDEKESGSNKIDTFITAERNNENLNESETSESSDPESKENTDSQNAGFLKKTKPKVMGGSFAKTRTRKTFYQAHIFPVQMLQKLKGGGTTSTYTESSRCTHAKMCPRIEFFCGQRGGQCTAAPDCDHTTELGCKCNLTVQCY